LHFFKKYENQIAIMKKQHQKKATPTPIHSGGTKTKHTTKNQARTIDRKFIKPTIPLYSLKINLFAYAIITLLSFGLYVNTIPFNYVFDDPIVITQNKFTTSEDALHGFAKIMGHDSFAGIFGEHGGIIEGGRYRPLSVITFAIEWQLFATGYRVTDRTLQLSQEEGVPAPVLKQLELIKNKDFETEAAIDSALNKVLGNQAAAQHKASIIDNTKKVKGKPAISHFINILLYTISGMLIFSVFARLFTYLERWHPLIKNQWFLSIPFIAAIFWIVHPIHTEVVANIKERDDILAMLGALATLWYSIRYLETNHYKYLIATFVTFFLGLLSKENTITFLAVIPMAHYCFTHTTIRQKLITIAPAVAASIVFIIMRQAILGEAANNNIPEKLMNDPFLYSSFAEKYATIFYTFGKYLFLLVFPVNLTVDYYPFHIPIIGWLDWRAIVPFIINVGLGVWALLTIKHKNFFAFNILFYFITFSIVSNFFFPIGTLMGERFIYLPSVAFCLILAYLLFYIVPEFIKRKIDMNAGIAKQMGFGIAISIVTISLFSFKTIDRNYDWESDFTLFSSAAKVSVGSAKSPHVLGELLLYKSRGEKDSTKRNELLQESIKYSKVGVDIHPRYVRCNHNLAAALFESNPNNLDTAMYYFLRAIEAQPYYIDSHSYLNGIVYPRVQDIDKKIELLNKVLQYATLDYRSHSNLGAYYLMNNDLPNALKHLDLAIRIEQKHPGDYNNLGVLYSRQNLMEKSAQMFAKAVELEPNNPTYIKNLIAIYQNMGKVQEAEKLLNRLQQIPK